jgi:hypothetical protein
MEHDETYKVNENDALLFPNSIKQPTITQHSSLLEESLQEFEDCFLLQRDSQ